MKYNLQAKLGGWALIALLSLAVTPVIGCWSQSTIAALTSTLGTSAASIATLEGNTALATQLKADTAAAVTAITAWKKGTPAQDAIQALAIVEDDLNLIPGTSQYAPLVALAIGTVQSILSLLPSAAPTTMLARSPVKMVHLMNPPKDSNQFKHQWNEIIAANPQLGAAAIK